MKVLDFEKGVETVPYQGQGMLYLSCIILFLDITFLCMYSHSFIYAILGHGLLLYGWYIQKKKFRITLRKNQIIRETAFSKRSFSLNEVAFIGLSEEPIRVRINEIHEKTNLIHLLLGNSHITINPRLFYEADSILFIDGTNEEQEKWKAMDECIISFLQENCKRVLGEKNKKELLSSYEGSDLPKTIFYLLVWSLPCIPAMIEECLKIE